MYIECSHCDSNEFEILNDNEETFQCGCYRDFTAWRCMKCNKPLLVINSETYCDEHSENGWESSEKYAE